MGIIYNLHITRDLHLSDTTLGKLNIDGKFFCFTLEDIVRATGVKIQNKTAIPVGTYKVKVTFSNHFQKRMPLIYNQEDLTIKLNGISFAGVRFHGGNTDSDTDGCVLVGHNRSEEQHKIWESASNELEALLDNEEVHNLIIE